VIEMTTVVNVTFERNGYQIQAKIEDGKWMFFNALTKQWVDNIDDIHDVMFTDEMFREFCDFKQEVKSAVIGAVACKLTYLKFDRAKLTDRQRRALRMLEESGVIQIDDYDDHDGKDTIIVYF
jgi:hypothetical protein